MCGVLDDMRRHGDLNQVVHRAPEFMYKDNAWYDSRKKTVNMTWLTNQWIRYICPIHDEAEEE